MRVNKEKLTAMFSAVAEGVVFHDARGCIEGCNQSAERILGVPESRMTGLAWADLPLRIICENGSALPGEMHPAMVTLWTGRPLSGVIIGIRKPDLSITWVSANTQATLRKEKVTGVVATFTEVSLQTSSDRALRASMERWELAVEGARDGIWDWNAETDEVFYSRRWKEMLGYEESEIGRSTSEWEDRIHPEDQAPTLAALNAHLRGESPHYESEYRLKTKSGEWMWVRARGTAVSRGPDGKALRFVGAHTDITSGKIAKEARREAERQYREIFEGAIEGVYRTTPKGKPLAVNPALARIMGYNSGEEMVAAVSDAGRQVWMDPEERARFIQLIEERGFVRGFECRHKRKDGAPIWVSLSARKVSNSHGKTLWYDGFLEDITERRRVEEQLRESEEKFATAFRLSPASASLIDLEDGARFIDVNNAFEITSGYRREEVVGRTLDDLGIFVDPQVLADGLGRLLEAGVLRNRELTFRRKDGELRTLLVAVEVIRLGGRRCAVSTSIDLTERILSEVKLRESERRFRLLFDGAPVSLWEGDFSAIKRYLDGLAAAGVTDLEAHLQAHPEEILWCISQVRMLDVNRATLELCQTTDKTALLSQWSAPLRGSALDVFRKGFLTLYRGEAFFRHEITVPSHIGNQLTCYAEVTLAPGSENSWSTVLLSLADITARKQAEDALRESEAKFRAVIENSHEGVEFLDSEGRILYRSPSFSAINGYATEDRLGQNAFQKVHPDDLKMVREAWARALEHPETAVTVHHRLLHKSGSWRWVETAVKNLLDNPHVRAVIASIRDVTEGKQAVDELARLAGAIEQAVETIVITDTAGNIVYANPAFETTSGYTVQEALGRNPRLLRSGEHNHAFYARMWGALTSGEVWRGRIRNKRKDGSLYEEEASISPVRDGAGRIVNYIAVKLDMTREAELQAQLVQAQKMECIGRLAGGVAHDFNNLLTVINGYSQLALADLEACDPLRPRLEEILKAGERAAGLTRQLLAFSRKQILQPRVLDLNVIVKEMQSMLRRLVGEDIEVRLALSAVDPTLQADPHQLEQVVMNLAVNARDAMPDGGRLLIETAIVERSAGSSEFEPNARPGRYAMLAVTDTGCGFDDATRRRIFEPFFTTKAAGHGTGLGLSMVHGIVAQSGGYISVYSEVDNGTSFKIYLPLLSGRAEEEAPAEVHGLRGNETVLVVEDQAEVRNFAVAAIESYGYRVIPASNGAEALEICEREREPLHLVVTDVVMPRISGREFVAQLAKKRPETKVLFMSGYTENAVAKQGALDGAAHFIQKPFSPHQLAGKIRAVLSGLSAPEDGAAGENVAEKGRE
jgi:PAS domain S-box-containing protein